MHMTSLRSRRLLEAVEEERSQVARLRETVRLLQERCTSTTRHYAAVSVSASAADRDRKLAELVEQQRLLQQHQKAFQELTDTLNRWIALLPRPRWRMILRYHYLDGLDLQDTCRVMSRDAGHCFSMSQIYRLHREALAAAEDLWPLSSIRGCAAAVFAPIESGTCPGLTAATAPRKAATDAGSALNNL